MNFTSNRNVSNYSFIDISDYIIATTIILALIGLLGFIGNLLVIVIYGCRSERSTNRTFVVCLAVADILVCSTTLPSEIFELNKHSLYDLEIVCKVSYFFTCSFVLSSAILLIPLSLDRYYRTCKLFGPQWQPKDALIRSVVVYMIAIIFSLPNLLIRGMQSHTSSNNVTEKYCLFSERYVNNWVSLSYNTFTFIIPVSTIIILTVIYILIGRSVFAQYRFRTQFRQSQTETKDGQKLRRDTASYQITKIALTIVVIYFLSYVPTSGLKLYEAVYGIDPYSTSNITGVLLATRFAYLLNHVINPFAYITMDKKFRQKAKILFCCWRNRT